MQEPCETYLKKITMFKNYFKIWGIKKFLLPQI